MIECTHRISPGAFGMKGCYWVAIILLGMLLASFMVGVALAQDPTVARVSAGNITDTSAVITWTTNERANSTVNYGTTISLGATASDSAFVTDHAVALTILTSSTVYYYEVVSSNQGGNTTVDDNGGAYHTFTTLDQGENLGYLVAAYTIIWIAISAYVFNLSCRQRQLRREIDSLKEKIREKGDDGGR